ncbi:tryptophan 7-halogenase [Roseovarius indicus]|uniref:tryptophan 7-halogenase n=1 Tax=Roseovarius indicus TaxID=540747 RepID=UPI000AD935F4|nr:tryptophan 7-halogenase [Roseovarius indicus]
MHGGRADERGHVTALTLQMTGRQEVELVLDCTGFRWLIINEVPAPMPHVAEMQVSENSLL